VASGDAGHTIDAVVTASNGSGQASASAPTVPLIDNFTADSGIDLNVWSELNQQGDTSNNEVGCYLPSQLSLSPTNGLVLSTRYVGAGFNCPAGTPGAFNPLFYQSGAVQMKSVNFLYGTVTVKAQLPAGMNTTHPTIWLLGASCQQPNYLTPGDDGDGDGNDLGYDCAWPNDSGTDAGNSDAAEVDIAETDGTDGVRTTVHVTGAGGGCSPITISTATTAMHTYEVDWTPTALSIKIDGNLVCGPFTGASVPQQPMFLIINDAICNNSFCGPPNPAVLPQQMDIASADISH
jgi:beta-glucanase (GH16 family)